jgi:hypothetical protein
MTRWLIIPTFFVTLAVATMVALGFWQLQRKAENEMLLRYVSANSAKLAIAYPKQGPVSVNALHRKSSLNCLRVLKWREDSGSDTLGKTGTRYLAECVTDAEGPAALIVAGISARPNQKVDWNGGLVSGVITTEPDRQSFRSVVFELQSRSPYLGCPEILDTRYSRLQFGIRADQIRCATDPRFLWGLFLEAA